MPVSRPFADLGHPFSWIRRWLAFWVVAATLPLTIHAADVIRNPPLEPDVAAASDEPSESISVMRVRDGWHVQLFAAEPDVANMVAMDVDPQGRVYVCETFRQERGVTDNRAHDETWLLADLAAETVQDRIDYHKRLLGDAAVTYAQHDDRIRRLVDTDGDGRADESTVLASGFNGLEEGTGAGVLVHGQDIFYTCIPKLWKLTDADDDGVAEKRVALSDGYGVRVAFRGHDLHGLLIGVDGRLYFTIGDRGYHVTTAEGGVLSNPAVGTVFRCELDGSKLEVYCAGLRNPQELAFNDVGDLFTVDNNSDSGDKARIVHLLQHGDSGWRMHYQYLPDRGPFNRQRIWEPLHPEQPAHIVPPIINFTDGPSGLAYYPGTGFGDTLKNRFLICDFRGGPSNSGIRSFELQPEGAFYKLATDEQPIWNVLATDVMFGPGGEMLVSDWVDGWNGLGKGRIYKITDPREQDSDIVADVRERLTDDWTQRLTASLVADLNHLDRRVRLNAQWELAARGEAAELLAVAAADDLPSHVRLHGIWGSEHAARMQPELRPMVLAANAALLADADVFVRAAACQLAADQLDRTQLQTLAALISDPAPRVRYFATMAVAKLADIATTTGTAVTPPVAHADVSTAAVVAMLAANANVDPALRHAGIRYLTSAATAQAVLDLQDHPSVDVRRAAVAALRNRLDGRVTEFFDDTESIVVSEATMAIHDQPIPVAIEPLADLIDRADLPLDQESLVRRVLSANYRIGTAETAAALADFAASDRSPAYARLEALDCLLDWAKPDPRCRVTNQHRPLPSRSTSVAATALTKRIDELMIASEDVREKAIDVASQLGVQKIAPELIRRVQNEQSRPIARAASLTALARLSAPDAVAFAKTVNLADPVPLINASLKVLGKHDRVASVGRFVEASASPTPAVAAQGWDILATIDAPESNERVADGVSQYLAGTLAQDVHLNVIEAAAQRLPSEVLDSLNRHQLELAQTDSLAKWLPSLRGGDVEKGSELFFGKTELSCVRCHKVDRAGGEVGPNLTVIGKTRDQRALLESICLPDATIAEGFQTAVIVDEDGRVSTGIVAAETDEFVELIAADGARVRIEQDLIVARKKGKSSMPAGLADLMTPRELRDLVAYLASLQVDPRGASDVE